jgi:hypothetical protein
VRTAALAALERVGLAAEQHTRWPRRWCVPPA